MAAMGFNVAADEMTAQVEAPNPALVQLPEQPTEYARDTEQLSNKNDSTAKGGRWRLFGLGKKALPDDAAEKAGSSAEPSRSTTRAVSPTSAPSGNVYSLPLVSQSTHPYGHSSSLSWQGRSPSPGVPSPASSQIFERDVQETALATSASPATPAHIQREDHIPPVLEASSLAITNDHLDPDEVKIVTHSSHQPAAAGMAGGSSGDAMASSWAEGSIPPLEKEDTASLYGTLDANDVRRLSFISFADVVQAEHAEHHPSKDGHHHLGGAPLMSSSFSTANRSPSPMHSRRSSQGFSTSPATSGPASPGGIDVAPGVAIIGPGSPLSAHSPPLCGEVTVETMSQALRKTGSSDLSGLRKEPMSAASAEGPGPEVPWR